jgi:dTDP-4-amino-4,6-dideoxygalactose transaminase
MPLIKPFQSKDCYSALHLYPIQIDMSNKVLISREQIFNELRDKGIGVNVHYIPIHLQPYYRNIGFKVGDFKNSEIYYESELSLPLFSSMTYEQQNKVVSTLRKILQ